MSVKATWYYRKSHVCFLTLFPWVPGASWRSMHIYVPSCTPACMHVRFCVHVRVCLCHLLRHAWLNVWVCEKCTCLRLRVYVHRFNYMDVRPSAFTQPLGAGPVRPQVTYHLNILWMTIQVYLSPNLQVYMFNCTLVNKFGSVRPQKTTPHELSALSS